MATRGTDNGWHEREGDWRAGATAARADVVDILAGAVVELLLQQGPHPSPDDAPSPENGSNTAIPRQIRGVP